MFCETYRERFRIKFLLIVWIFRNNTTIRGFCLEKRFSLEAFYRLNNCLELTALSSCAMRDSRKFPAAKLMRIDESCSRFKSLKTDFPLYDLVTFASFSSKIFQSEQNSQCREKEKRYPLKINKSERENGGKFSWRKNL